jgi:phage tail P2-like protein
MSHDLLPPNATALDSALATATDIDLPTSGLRGIGASATCPAPALPWLAWERSVENFDAAATEESGR